MLLRRQSLIAAGSVIFVLLFPSEFKKVCSYSSRLSRSSTAARFHPLHKQLRSGSFDDFDYRSHWYPVSWARDIRPNTPTQVTIFDVDYVIAKIEDKRGKGDNISVVAMEDRCPHKSAFLSEGRITSSGLFQCAYHGWTFDGKNGDCVEIPQVAIDLNDEQDKSGALRAITARACGKAIPAMVVQGMIWLFPGGNLETALLAPPPPIIPEIDQPGFRMIPTVRDFPIDFSILLENIMDPDHGLFAHGVSSFDLYAASRYAPQTIQEEFSIDGKAWKITSRVDAIDKLVAFDRMKRKRRRANAKHGLNSDIRVATTTFTAPNHVVMGRRDREKGITTFITAFWICPTGVGRSRFMSAAIGKLPISIPRWFLHVNLNNFLDQDTHLLATQQRNVLAEEAKILMQKVARNETALPTNLRKSFYVYRSPSEKLGLRLGQFFDATLNRVPNRIPTLLEMGQSGLLRQTPTRECTLDRERQHLRICPDSQDAVRNCLYIQRTAFVTTLAAILGSAASFLLANPVASTVVAATQPVSSKQFIFGVAQQSPVMMRIVAIMSSMAWFAARKIRREFYYKYTEKYRDRDLKNIPNVWLDI